MSYSNLKYKSAFIDITPVENYHLTGMTEESQLSLGIHSSLEINAMLFKSFETKILLISIDTLFVTQEIIDRTSSLICEKISIEKENIIFSSTHTHYAPSIEKNRPKLGSYNSEYTNSICDKISGLADELNAKPFANVTLSYSEKTSKNLTANRRRKVRTLKHLLSPFISMEPNIDGYTNETFRILSIINENQNEIGVIWSFPCHLTNLYDNTLISSEYPGKIREEIRQQLNTSTVIYFPGFAGDVRAYPPTNTSLNKKLRTFLGLSYPTNFYRFTNKDQYHEWVSNLSASFWEAHEGMIEIKSSDDKINTKIHKEPLKKIGLVSKETNELIFRAVDIGNAFKLITISAEPVAGLDKIINSVFPNQPCIYTGYTDAVFGYFPTSNQIDEGGYESGGYFENFEIEGRFVKNGEKIIEDSYQKLMR